MKAIAISLCLICTSFLSFGQTEATQEKMPIVGIGLNLTQFRLSDLMGTELYLAPANTIMVEMTPLKYLRLTPAFGVLSEKYVQKVGPNETEKDAKALSLNYGIGAFGMYQREKTNIYAGLRYELAQVKNDYYEYNFDYDPIFGPIETINAASRYYTRSTITPTIGAEYFFARHFSIGGEFGLRIMQFKFENKTQYGFYDQDTDSAIATDAGIQLRFYF